MADRFEEDFIALLEANTALRTACPTIAWNLRPQGSALPALALTIASEVPNYTLSGEVTLVPTRVQCDIWAASLPDALRVDRAFTPLVSGYIGAVGTTDFDSILVLSRFSGTDEATGVVLHRISRDLMVQHRSLTP